MPKATKVINGINPSTSTTLSSAVFTTVYTVPTGKVARVEILLGEGIRTSDFSIDMWYEDAPLKFGPNTLRGASNSTAAIPTNYTIAVHMASLYNTRNVTYLKAGNILEVPFGRYSILIVEEDAG